MARTYFDKSKGPHWVKNGSIKKPNVKRISAVDIAQAQSPLPISEKHSVVIASLFSQLRF